MLYACGICCIMYVFAVCCMLYAVWVFLCWRTGRVVPSSPQSQPGSKHACDKRKEGQQQEQVEGAEGQKGMPAGSVKEDAVKLAEH